MLESYDPDVAPDPDEWLALSELDRMGFVEIFHEDAGEFGENLQLHTVVHVVVENQLALGDPAQAREAMARLLRDGLSRHDAVHAIGSVIAEHLFPIFKNRKNPPPFDDAAYRRALAKLTAASWRRDYG